MGIRSRKRRNTRSQQKCTGSDTTSNKSLQHNNRKRHNINCLSQKKIDHGGSVLIQTCLLNIVAMVECKNHW